MRIRSCHMVAAAGGLFLGCIVSGVYFWISGSEVSPYKTESLTSKLASTENRSGSAFLPRLHGNYSPGDGIERLLKSLDIPASDEQVECWPAAIRDSELALLLPETREAALRILGDVATSTRGPSYRRCLAILIIGDAAPDVARDYAWDLIEPHQGITATAAVCALMINDSRHSSFELWREILTGDYAKLFFPAKAVNQLEALFANADSSGQLIECFSSAAAMNSFRRDLNDPGWGWGPDQSSACFQLHAPTQEFQDRIVGVISGLDGTLGSHVLWKFLAGSASPAMRQIILHGHHSASVKEGAVAAIDDDRFLIDSYRAMADPDVRWRVLEKFAFYYDTRTHDRVLELCKQALTFERVQYSTIQCMAYGASITTNARVIEYLGTAALRSEDADFRDAVMTGLGAGRRRSEAVYGVFRAFLAHRDERVRIKAISELVSLRDPSAGQLCEYLSRKDPSEDVRQAALKLASTLK